MIEYEHLGNANRAFFEEYQESFTKTLESGWYILGNHVKAFEAEYAAWHGVPHCIGVANGLDALMLALRACGLPAGSEILVPSNTYIATILAVLQAGLIPVLVEPDIHTYNIDPAAAEASITPNTAGIMPVHLYGKPCQMDALTALCKKHNLILVEDCAQSHGARYNGKLTGTFGQFGAFSFYPTKNLGALGDAGALITADAQLAQKIRRLRNYGSDVKYYNEVAGFNSRLDELQAGFLLVKLRHLQAITGHKRALANLYLAGLKEDFILPTVEDSCYDVYHIFAIRHPKRDQLKEYLLQQGIKTEIHYPVPPHKQKAMQGILPAAGFPVSEEIHRTILSLPISYAHTEGDVLKVIDVMNRF